MNKPKSMNMEIRLSNLKDGNHIFNFDNKPEDFEIPDAGFKSTIKTKVNLDKFGSQFDLKINTSGIYFLDCERCLEKYELKFDINFELIYKFDFKGDFLGTESDEDTNLIFISPNTHHIDIKNDVRDFLILNIPMRKIPDEVDGKCEFCGKDTAIDYPESKDDVINPVWEKLLKNKNN